MGIGQVVTLEVPASKLRDVNLALERGAWKAFRTEFYPTYDYYPVVRDKLANKNRLSLYARRYFAAPQIAANQPVCERQCGRWVCR
jgi:hypothetical protein